MWMVAGWLDKKEVRRQTDKNLRFTRFSKSSKSQILLGEQRFTKSGRFSKSGVYGQSELTITFVNNKVTKSHADAKI